MTATLDRPRQVKTTLPPEYRNYDRQSEPLATFLGVFSVGLGLAELLAPHRVAELSGVRYPRLLQLYGARELAAGLGILLNRNPAMWLNARVAGDGLDLATLAAAYADGTAEDRPKVLAAAAAVAGVTALDILCAREHN